MARNRTPQTQEKRRREHEKQVQRQDKMAKRQARSAAKKDGEPMPQPEARSAAELFEEMASAGMPPAPNAKVPPKS